MLKLPHFTQQNFTKTQLQIEQSTESCPDSYRSQRCVKYDPRGGSGVSEESRATFESSSYEEQSCGVSGGGVGDTSMSKM